MMLRTKLKLRNFLREFITATIFFIFFVLALGIVGHYDYEDYCLHHPSECTTIK